MKDKFIPQFIPYWDESENKQVNKILHADYLNEHKTVREFEKALHQAIPIDQDSLTLLTRLYEVADYSESIPKSMDRDTAVNSLRTVLESIESLIETSGG